MMQGFYMLALQRARRQRRIALAACAAALISAFFAARVWFAAPAMPAAASAEPYVALSENGQLVVLRGGEIVLRTAIDTRTLPQAEAFDRMLTKIGTQVTVMLALDVPDEVVTERILTRGKTSGRSDDQSIDTIKNRIEVYKAQTAVVADFYKKADKFRAVNGVGTIDEIFGRLCDAIDALK